MLSQPPSLEIYLRLQTSPTEEQNMLIVAGVEAPITGEIYQARGSLHPEWLADNAFRTMGSPPRPM